MPTRLEQLLAMIDDPGDDCIVWKYAGGRYGHVAIGGGRSTKAHRVACEHAHGPAPEGKPNALHSCHVPRCVNPRHLRWGDQRDNVADAAEAGTLAVGERAGNSVLTEDDVRAIRAARGEVTQVALAERFGVAQNTISAVQTGIRWSHVD